MNIGEFPIDDKSSTRLTINLLAAILTEVQVQREFLMAKLSDDRNEIIAVIDKVYQEKLALVWSDLTQRLYTIYGNLDLEDLLKKP